MAIHSTALRSKSGSGPCGPNCRGPPSSRDRWPVPMIATRRSDGQLSTSSRIARPSRRTDVAAASVGRRCWCRSARSADPPRGRRVMIGQVIEWSIRSSLLKARSKFLSRPVRRMWAARSSWPRSVILGRPNSRSSLYQLRVEERCLADQELRHVVQPQLVEVIAADHHQHVGAGPGERLPEAADLGSPTRRRTAVDRLRWPCSPGSRTGDGSRRSPRDGGHLAPPGRPVAVRTTAWRVHLR